MQLRVVRRIESAVQSITACTSPQVQVGGVVAQAHRLCSPYASRHTVEYSQAKSPLPWGVLYASSGCYNLIILRVVDAPERYIVPRPVDYLVTEWEGDLIPATLVRPAIQLARELGLRPEGLEGELLPVFVLSQTLAGWHYGRPVFWVATGDENRPLELDGEPAYRQGSLLIGWDGSLVPIASASWEHWAGAPSQWFFNHATAYNLDRDAVLSTVPTDAMASPVAVLYNGEPHAAVRLCGPATIVARDHDTLEVPEGYFLAIHPFPARGGDVD